MAAEQKLEKYGNGTWYLCCFPRLIYLVRANSARNERNVHYNARVETADSLREEPAGSLDFMAYADS